MATITGMTVTDVRFPTSLEAHGSDAMHGNPDYSAAYLELTTDTDYKGFGFAFTLGKGTDLICQTIRAMRRLVVGWKVLDILDDFAGFWRLLTSDTQMRWIGPEKGIIHLATAAIVNALWDMWARMENKPLWKLLVDMDPEKLVSTIDFRYLSDVLTKDEAIEMLKNNESGKKEREEEMLVEGFPAYTTSAGWLGYSNERIQQLCTDLMAQGFDAFKIKVGADLNDDIRRCEMVRKQIGDKRIMMTDANQRWDVQQAIDWMKELAKFNIHWIEEPTSPDDILGHAAISKALAPYGIGVATGEMCQNRVMFKQFLQAGGLQFCQIDSCRLGGVNEIIAVLLMAKKFNVPVCPHAGGVGLCELVQHLVMFDYISVSASLDNRTAEYVNHLHEHFVDPVHVKNAQYMPPKMPGYSTEMKGQSLIDYTYPEGVVWQQLFREGKFTA